MSQKIKNTLFRLTSIREPELSDENGLSTRFVFFPENLQSGSFFYDDVIISDDKWKALIDLSKIFENTANFYSTESQIKMDLNNIYPFSVWLVRNKSTCTEQELQDKVDEVSNSTVSTAI